MIKSQDTAYSGGPLEVGLKGISNKIIAMDMELCIGLMERSMKDSGLMACKKVKGA